MSRPRRVRWPTIVLAGGLFVAACGPTPVSPTPSAPVEPSPSPALSGISCGPLETNPASCAEAVNVAIGLLPADHPAITAIIVASPPPEALCTDSPCRAPTIIVSVLTAEGQFDEPLVGSQDSWNYLGQLR